jgi:prepilin-type N-terminal cleavage/methylation domain-containing protein
MSRKTDKRAAFTLIEISIVLVIIGLIVGGVLLGQDLIEGARMRAQISQLEKFDSAVTTFKLKYNALPGDVWSPTQFGLGFDCSPPNHGNQNGIIEDENGSYPPSHTNCEPVYFFVHLQQAQLISELNNWSSAANSCYNNGQYSQTIGCQFPEGKVGSGGFLAHSDASGTLGYFFGMSLYDPTVLNPYNITQHTNNPVITPMQAYQLDVKLDDGLPMTGNIKSMIRPQLTDNVAGNCITTVVGNAYNIPNTNLACRLWIRSSAG